MRPQIAFINLHLENDWLRRHRKNFPTTIYSFNSIPFPCGFIFDSFSLLSPIGAANINCPISTIASVSLCSEYFGMEADENIWNLIFEVMFLRCHRFLAKMFENWFLGYVFGLWSFFYGNILGYVPGLLSISCENIWKSNFKVMFLEFYRFLWLRSSWRSSAATIPRLISPDID